MKKGYLTPPVLIILAIIIFAVAILITLNTDFVKPIKNQPIPGSSPAAQYSSPTPDASPALNSSAETADWKTYTDKENKFFFKYPQEWSIRKNDHGTSVDYSLLSSDFKLNENNHLEEEARTGAKMDIFVFASTPLKPAVSGQTYQGTDTTYSRKISNVKSLTIDGRTAQEFDYVAVGLPTLMGSRFEVSKGGTLYVLDIVYSSVSFKKTFDQTLSTFRFLD